MSLAWLRLLALACAAAATFPGRSLTAQDANRAMTGRVRDSAGAPLADVSVRLSRDTTTIVARTDNQGRFRFTGLVDGDYMLSALRVGFSPVAEPVTITRDGVHRELVITARTPVLDSVLVRAQWTGVRGIVFDARNLTPIAGARVQLMGTDSVVRSDADGTFAIGWPRGRAVVVRVERDGFLPVLRSADIPDKGYVELDLPLDMATRNARDLIEQKDLQLRLKLAGAQAVFVTGADLRRSGALSAKEAFYESTSGRRSGVSITRQTCVFVNGQPRPGFPFDALRAADIEFLEAYPGNAENSRTLLHRWPPGAPCGAPGPTERLGDPRSRAQVVSVWTRQLP
jgi:hypothetical protein